MSIWQPIETAPKDGTVFIARNADHPSFGSWPMLRRVRYLYQDGLMTCIDGNGWLQVMPIEPDYDHGADTPVEAHVPFSLAPDDLNRSVCWEWQPLPTPLEQDESAEPAAGSRKGDHGRL